MDRNISLLSCLIVIACLVSPRVGWSYGLGDLDVQSHLQQPLKAMIRLIGTGEPESLSARMMPGDYYDARGLVFVPVMQQAEVTVQRQGAETWLVVTTDTPVNEFLLDLAVEITHGRLTQVRHYTLLIDIQESAGTVSSAAGLPPESATQAAPATARSQSPTTIERTGTSSVSASEHTYGPIRTGESLWKISERLRGDQKVGLYELMDRTVALNPHAFVSGDPNRLKVGATLRIPDMSTGFVPLTNAMQQTNEPPEFVPAPQVVRSELDDLFNRKANNSPIARADQLEITAASGEDITKVLDTWIESDNQPVSADRTERIRRDLAIAAAEQETLDLENEQLVSQIEALEKRVTDLQQLLTLQEAVIERRSAGIQNQPEPASSGIESPVIIESTPSRNAYTTWIAALLGLIAAGALGYLGWHSLQWRRRYEQGPTLDIKPGRTAANTLSAPSVTSGIEVDEYSSSDEAEWSEVLEAAELASKESQAELAEGELRELAEALDQALPNPSSKSEATRLEARPVPAFDLDNHAQPQAQPTDEAAQGADNSEALLMQARTFINEGHHDDAESLLETVLRKGNQAQRAEATYLFLEMS